MTQALLSLRIAELLALESQLTDPPRPMSPSLQARLEVAFRRTEQEVGTLLRAASSPTEEWQQAGQ